MIYAALTLLKLSNSVENSKLQVQTHLMRNILWQVEDLVILDATFQVVEHPLAIMPQSLHTGNHLLLSQFLNSEVTVRLQGLIDDHSWPSIGRFMALAVQLSEVSATEHTDLRGPWHCKHQLTPNRGRSFIFVYEHDFTSLVVLPAAQKSSVFLFEQVYQLGPPGTYLFSI